PIALQSQSLQSVGTSRTARDGLDAGGRCVVSSHPGLIPSLDLRAAAAPYRPNLTGVSPDLRAAAIGTWKARMVNEYSSSGVFEALAQQLGDAGEDGDLVRECQGFSSEERMH